MTRARPRWIGCAALALGLVVVGAAAPVSAEPSSLAGHCLRMTGAGRAACRSTLPPSSASASAPALVARASPDVAASAAPGSSPAPVGFADFAAGYSLYRLVSATEGQRRCRLQPTCSLFAARAARRFGLLRGLLMGLARAQMAHSDQDGFLTRAVASDGRFIFLDPVELWVDRAR
jgi:hypothetical protein